jgi:hypothetical protein
MPSVLSPRFVTHHEINEFIGERTRQRWEQDGTLPTPDWIRSDRGRVAIFPELVLARLVVGKTKSVSEQEAVREALSRCTQLFATDGYHRFKAVVEAVLAARKGMPWSFVEFVRDLGEADSDAVAAWQSDVLEIEDELNREGRLSFKSIVARVKDADPTRVIVVTDTGDSLVRDPLVGIEPGVTVVLERVAVESREREFVLPTLAVETAQVAGDLRLATQGEEMAQTDPFELISARSAFSVGDLLDPAPAGSLLTPREAFDRSEVTGLLLHEEELPYAEPAQRFSFAFDSPAIEEGLHALV